MIQWKWVMCEGRFSEYLTFPWPKIILSTDMHVATLKNLSLLLLTFCLSNLVFSTLIRGIKMIPIFSWDRLIFPTLILRYLLWKQNICSIFLFFSTKADRSLIVPGMFHPSILRIYIPLTIIQTTVMKNNQLRMNAINWLLM